MRLTQEQINQARACRTEEDCRAFLKNNRLELTPEEIEMVNGGGLFDFIKKIGESIADAVSEIFD